MKSSGKLLSVFLEFAGAFSLTLLIIATNGRTSFPFFGALTAGVLFAMLILSGRRDSIVQANPIVTLGFWMWRRITTGRMIVNIIAQFVGALVAGHFTQYLLDQLLTNVSGGRFVTRAFVAEIVGAFIFTLILSLVLRKKDATTNQVAFVGGAALFVGMLVASLAGNGLVNPALSLGRMSLSWTYFLAPFIGGLLGMNAVAFMEYVDAKVLRLAPAKSSKVVVKKKKVVKKQK